MCWNNGNIISVLRLCGARRPILLRLASHSLSPCHDFTPFYIRNGSSSVRTHTTHMQHPAAPQKKRQSLSSRTLPSACPWVVCINPRMWGFLSVYSSWWKTCQSTFVFECLYLEFNTKQTACRRGPPPRRGQSNKATQSQEGTKVVSVLLPADTRHDYNTKWGDTVA